MFKETQEQKVRKYYSTLEAKLGWHHVLWDAKHFGFYPIPNTGITEQQALKNQQDKIGQTLNLQPSDIVLDAGCGRGVTASYLAKQYRCKVVGIDLLDFELEIAKQIAIENKVVDKTEFHVMDFSSLKFPDNFFDAIYGSETLSHAPDVGSVIREFYRVLKPGGKMVLMEYTLAEDNQFAAAQMNELDFIIEGSAMMGLKQFRHDKFPPVMSSIGFKNSSQEDITANIFPSLERLYRIARFPNFLVRALGLKKYFVNTITPSTLIPLGKKGLIRYCMFSATK